MTALIDIEYNFSKKFLLERNLHLKIIDLDSPSTKLFVKIIMQF